MLLNILPQWFLQLVTPTDNPSPPSSLILIFIVMAAGIMLGKIRIQKVSLGISGVMFAGIIAGHLGHRLEERTMEFLRDGGLILFV